VSGVHSPSWNSIALGVEMLGDYDKDAFDSGRGAKVRDNAVAAMATLSAVLGLDPNTMRLHREDPATTHACPGKNVKKLDVIQRVQEQDGRGGQRGTRIAVSTNHSSEVSAAIPATAGQAWGLSKRKKRRMLGLRALTLAALAPRRRSRDLARLLKGRVRPRKAFVMTPTDPLVSTAWLADHLDAPDVRVVDGSWHMPAAKRDPRAEYDLAHIPGAVFFDIDEISDETSDLPHMLPSPIKFASRVKKLGLGDGSRIVVYDTSGILPAARVWWEFRAMGHEDVVVLDGGLPKWIAEGRPVEDLAVTPQERHFTPRFQADIVRSIDQMKRNLENLLKTGAASR
jgi:rhodanese-related sulfurtransferase